VPTQVFRYKPVQGRLAPIITIGIKLGEVLNPKLDQSDSERKVDFRRDWGWRSTCSGGQVSSHVSRSVFRNPSVFWLWKH